MQHDEITSYRKALAENIYSCMELSKQSYLDICYMPIKRFHDYLKWKTDLEDARQKEMEESSKRKRR